MIASADMVIIHNIIPPELLPGLPEKKTFFFAHDHNIYCQRHHYYFPVGRINCHRKYNKFICKVCSLGRNPAPPLAEYRKLPALVLSDFMQENLRKNGSDLAPCSIYFSFYYLQACLAYDMDDLAEKRLDKWRALENEGLTTFPEEFENPRSDCHAWSSHILAYLLKKKK